jgi:DNA-binding FadR family transcriptional regulator
MLPHPVTHSFELHQVVAHRIMNRDADGARAAMHEILAEVTAEIAVQEPRAYGV